MPHLVLVILDNFEVLPDLLKAWREAGVSGATILESAGAYRATGWLGRMGLGALDRLFESDEVRRRTVFSVVETNELLDKAVGEAERVVGGFEQPDTGVLIVLPISEVRGLRKVAPAAESQPSPPAVRAGWLVQRDALVSEAMALLDLKPVQVSHTTPLDQVAVAMQEQPRVRVACVINDEGRLVGLLSLRALADDLFFHIMPEEFLSESFNLDRAKDFAQKSRLRTAGDAMQPAIWIKKSDKVREAFKRMHDNQLPGLPVVDDRYQVIGYINLIELLLLCFKQADAHPKAAGD